MHWTPCKGVYCGPCYTPHRLDKFFHYTPVDEDGFEWRPADDLNRHKYGRNGDHLLTPFQCDLCSFRNLQGRNPVANSYQDDMVLCCIRRVTLDSLWGREPNTVMATERGIRQMLEQWKRVGLKPDLPLLGPYPVEDSFGMRVAIAMVLKSLEPGKYHAEYQQFETIRKLSAAYTNLYMASREGAISMRAMGGDKAKHYINACPTYSDWFGRFKQGCLRRMGQDVRQDWAITLHAMGALMQLLEREWQRSAGEMQKLAIAQGGAYALIAFCGSFRGNEVFLVDLFGLRKYLQELKEKNFVMIPLLGRFKGEQHSRYHLQPLAAETSSGLKVRVWVERLVTMMTKGGSIHGPAFGDGKGGIVSARLLEGYLMDKLQQVKDTQPGVIPSDMDCFEDFGISRSFRRGATSTARTRGVGEKQIDLINRWRKFEGAKGRRPAMGMQDHFRHRDTNP